MPIAEEAKRGTEEALFVLGIMRFFHEAQRCEMYRKECKYEESFLLQGRSHSYFVAPRETIQPHMRATRHGKGAQ